MTHNDTNNTFMFEKNNDGKIRFIDTSRITYEQWSKLKHKLNHLKYDFNHENDIKEYFDRGTWLNKDQSDVVLEVLIHQKSAAMFDEHQMQSDITRAKEYYGITYRYDLAGYILPDGSCLDFSDGQPMRTMDHREIKEILESSLPENYNYNDPMVLFMNYGCIRLMNNGLALIQPPTLQQRQTIKNIIREQDSFYIDICNNSGFTVKSFNYDIITNINIGETLTNIDSYFKLLEID